MTSRHRSSRRRLRRRPLLLALPMAGALAAAGLSYGGPGTSAEDGGIALTGLSAVDGPGAATVRVEPAARGHVQTPSGRWSSKPPRTRPVPTVAVSTVSRPKAASGSARTTSGSARTTSGSATATATAADGAFAEQVVALTNERRRDAGCPALTVDARLTAAAQGHSDDMARRSYFDHDTPEGVTPFDRITSAGYRYRMAAENIAAGHRTPAQVVEAWMKSAGHRRNIENCGLTEIGVGFATGGAYGTYWTQDFGTPPR